MQVGMVYNSTSGAPQNFGAVAAPATSGAMVVPVTNRLVTITPTGACTFNAGGGGLVGQEMTFLISTSGTSSFTLTFGTNFRKAGTLATGTANARFFTVNFISDGTRWWETSRTAAQT